MKAPSLFAFALLFAAPAFASVTVSSPENGSTVTSPFTLTATASPCSSQPIVSMAYSLDDVGATTADGASIHASVNAAPGIHLVRAKSYGADGAVCVSTVYLKVSAPSDLAVIAPANGASVRAGFTLDASGTMCDGQPVTALGYSVDDDGSGSMFSGTKMRTGVTTSAGSHILHVKAWGSGVSCATSLRVNVTAPGGPPIPSNAAVTTLIHNRTDWRADHDMGTKGTSVGATSLVSAPSVSGSSRKFATSYTNYGGERYNVHLPLDQRSKNFVYDTQIYIAAPSRDLSNIEMDLNQVMLNGKTVIFGFQCDVWSHTWDYTQNMGTASSPVDRWMHSNQNCNPQEWTTNAWHHVQIQYSRDDSGNVTYKAVWLDGVKQDIGVTAFSAFALGWRPALNTNFQVGGYTSTSGSSTIYLDNLTLYSW